MTGPSPLLSDLVFGACLSYTSKPDPDSDLQKLSKTVCHQIKVDGRVRNDPRFPGVAVLPLAVTRLRENLSPELSDLLSSDVLLVPAPGSSPQRKGSLWVPERICYQMLDAGLGKEMEPLLVRRLAVPKSAFAASSDRPTPLRHYETLGVIRRLGVAPQKITVVDDVITRGATLLAAASLLREVFPEAVVRAFALVRTVKPELFRAIVDPVVGRVVLHGDYTQREP